MKSHKLVIGILYCWPFLSFVLLIVLAGLPPRNLNYSSNPDQAFWTTATITLIGHAIAFITPVMPVLFMRWRHKSTFAHLIGVGFTTLCMQLYMRFLADSVSRLDCYDQCVADVMPIGLGKFLNVLTGATLVVMLGIILLIGRSKNKNIEGAQSPNSVH